jgi:hypothetical protein
MTILFLVLYWEWVRGCEEKRGPRPHQLGNSLVSWFFSLPVRKKMCPRCLHWIWRLETILCIGGCFTVKKFSFLLAVWVSNCSLILTKFIGSVFVVKNWCHMLGIKSCKQTEHVSQWLALYTQLFCIFVWFTKMSRCWFLVYNSVCSVFFSLLINNQTL